MKYDEENLRDDFACEAIGLFPLGDSDLVKLGQGWTPDHKVVAKFCYDLADAMIEERRKRDG